MRRKLSAIQKTVNFRTFRYTWKREIILALSAVEEKNALSVWENLFGINSQLAFEELSSFEVKNKVLNNQPIQRATSSETIKSEEPINVFISYSHKDEKWKDKLKSHLSALRN